MVVDWRIRYNLANTSPNPRSKQGNMVMGVNALHYHQLAQQLRDSVDYFWCEELQIFLHFQSIKITDSGKIKVNLGPGKLKPQNKTK